MLLHRLFDGFKAAVAPTAEEPKPERAVPVVFVAFQSVAMLLALASLMIALKTLGRVVMDPRPR